MVKTAKIHSSGVLCNISLVEKSLPSQPISFQIFWPEIYGVFDPGSVGETGLMLRPPSPAGSNMTFSHGWCLQPGLKDYGRLRPAQTSLLFIPRWCLQPGLKVFFGVLLPTHPPHGSPLFAL
jgi:hypothetical protein